MEDIKDLINNIKLNDSLLREIRIYQEDNSCLNLEIRFLINNKIIKINFIDVIEYQFYFNNSYYFENIEDYKFFLTHDKKVYLSLDPCFDSLDCNVKDMDFVKSNSLKICND